MHDGGDEGRYVDESGAGSRGRNNHNDDACGAGGGFGDSADIADDAGGVDEGDLPFCGSADVDKGDQTVLDQVKCVLRQ